MPTDRILTTHVGALQRPADVDAVLLGEGSEETLTKAVADVVRKQAEVGLDIVNDGEFGKSVWQFYALDRLAELAVVDDVEAGLDLAGDDLGGCGGKPGGEYVGRGAVDVHRQ